MAGGDFTRVPATRMWPERATEGNGCFILRLSCEEQHFPHLHLAETQNAAVCQN